MDISFLKHPVRLNMLFWCSRLDFCVLVLKYIKFALCVYEFKKTNKKILPVNPLQVSKCVCVFVCVNCVNTVHSVCAWWPVTTHTCRAVYRPSSCLMLSSCISASYHTNKVCLNVKSFMLTFVCFNVCFHCVRRQLWSMDLPWAGCPWYIHHNVNVR